MLRSQALLITMLVAAVPFWTAPTSAQDAARSTAGNPPASTVRNRQYTEAIQPLLKQACFDCHSGAEAKAGLSLALFDNARAVFKERAVWEKVAQRIEIGDMPPHDAEPMSDANRKLVVDWIRSTLNEIDSSRLLSQDRCSNRFEMEAN